MSNKKVILISFDGLSTLDYDYVSKLDNFKKLIDKSRVCKNMRTIYPSLTYPAHTSIVTGKTPGEHGIVSNSIIDLKHDSPDWYWTSNYIKGPTVYDKAIDNKLKVASLLWPVTGKSRIQYNMPEIFANRWWQNQIIASALNGSIKYQVELNSKFGHLRDGLKQPNLDNFTHECLKYTLKKYKINLMMVHFTDLDFIRHDYGFFSKEAYEALDRHDKRLGEILNLIEEEEEYKDASLIIFGDHSSMDTDKVIFLNSYFKEKNYLTLENNKIKDYKVLAKSCDGSTYVYIKNMELLNEVKHGLDLLQENYEGIEKVFDKSEIIELGADSKASFMIEAKKGYYFSDEINENIIEDVDSLEKRKNKKYLRSSHGYHPDKEDYRSLFFYSSSLNKDTSEIEDMRLEDIKDIIEFELNLVD